MNRSVEQNEKKNNLINQKFSVNILWKKTIDKKEKMKLDEIFKN